MSIVLRVYCTGADKTYRSTMDSILNGLFFVFHTAWIAFNCVGWIWRRTRPWQLATVSLTALSWFGLGVWYGWGYCPCTDWHGRSGRGSVTRTRRRIFSSLFAR